MPLEEQSLMDEKFMRLALLEADAAMAEGEVPVGAVIVSNGRVIARAHNLTERLRDVTAHAEMQAITSAADFLNGKYLRGCTIYVTLEPCAMCAAALGWSQISRIVYGAPDPKRGYKEVYGSDRGPLHPKTLVSCGILEEECKGLMREFFTRLR